MKLGESAKKAYQSAYSAKEIVLTHEHDKRMREIGDKIVMPVVLDGKQQMVPIPPLQKLESYINEVKRYLRDLVNARIDAFIEIHESIDEAPYDEDIQELMNELVRMANGFTRHIPRAYQSMMSPVPKELFELHYEACERELNTYPGRHISRLKAFVDKARLLRERGLSINGSTPSPVNIVNVGRDINGPVQLGANRSSQIVAEIQRAIQSELSGEEQKHIAPPIDDPIKIKIAERQKNRTLLMVEIYKAANGGRARQVLLSEITEKLELAEDAAEDIHTYYHDKGYFETAYGGMVSLSHYGIVSIEESILEYQDPPDLVLDIQKRQELRVLLLKGLFEKAGGSSRKTVNFNDIAKEEEISEDDIDDFLYHLMDEGFIEFEAIGGWVSITSRGIQEIEDRAIG